jgi:predicted DNA-binding transcriptional regulator YafY
MNDTLQRQWAMLRMLRRAPRMIGSQDILSRLEAQGMHTTLRTIQRDLHSLALAFPIICDDSKPKGWAWRAESGQLDIPGMDLHTALTFSLVEQYMQKLLPPTTLSHITPWFDQARSVMSTSSSSVTQWKSKIRVVDRALRLLHPLIKSEVQAAIYDGLFNGVQVEVTYEAITKDEGAKTYCINPLGLVIRDQVVYLACTIRQYKDVRFLALHRVSAATLLASPIVQLKNFDIDQSAATTLGILQGEKPMKLEIKVKSLIAKYLAESPIAKDQQITITDDDWFSVKVTLPDSQQVRAWLMGMGGDVEVIKPSSLRGEFQLLARDLIGKYPDS